MSDLRTFLDLLYRDCTGGVVECRALPSTRRAWATPRDWSPFGSFLTDAVTARQNAYVGVCTRRDASSGTAANLCEAPAVWVDFDHSRADLDARLARFPFQPGLIVASGLYFQLYFLLREPFALQASADLARFASVLRRLSSALDGDDRATDPARILRLPTTFNYKYDTPRTVTLVSTADTTVDLSELEDVLPREVVVRNVLTVDSKITQGSRNDTLHARARGFACRGASLPEIYRQIEMLNREQCDPPLDADELRRIAISASTEKDAPDFVRPTLVVIHDATPPPPAPDGTAVFVNLADVTATTVTWHWSKRLAAGKGVMLAGDPGTGKSMITTSLAAAYTTGGPWPDGGTAPQGRVMFLIAEDGLSDTVRPRVEAHGGDVSQIDVLTAVQDKSSERPFTLARDLAALDDGLRRLQPKLLVIDPLNSYLGRVDSYRDADIRGVLSPLLGCVEKYGCALLWVAHLTKNDEVKALYRPGASIGFIASARMALIVGEHPHEPGTMVLAQSKNNLAQKDVSLSYRIVDGTVCWGEVVDLGADAILHATTPEDLELAGTAAGLIALLRSESLTGSIDVKEANARAALLDIPERTLRAAARRAGLTPYRKGNGRDHHSYWFDAAHPANAAGGGGQVAN